MKMKALLIPGLLLALSFAGYNLSQQWGEAKVVSRRDAELQARNDEASAKYAQILESVNAPATVDVEKKGREAVIGAVVQLKGALATTSSANDLLELQLNLKWYAEVRDANDIPSSWSNVLPSALRAKSLAGRCAKALDRSGGAFMDAAALSAIRSEALRFSAEIEAGLPMLK